MASRRISKVFGQTPYVPKHNQKNDGGGIREIKLDMKREKDFRIDLEELLTECKVGDNKNTIAATTLNKITRQSLESTHEYLERTREAGALDEATVGRIKALLKRYSKWR